MTTTSDTIGFQNVQKSFFTSTSITTFTRITNLTDQFLFLYHQCSEKNPEKEFFILIVSSPYIEILQKLPTIFENSIYCKILNM